MEMRNKEKQTRWIKQQRDDPRDFSNEAWEEEQSHWRPGGAHLAQKLFTRVTPQIGQEISDQVLHSHQIINLLHSCI